MTQLFSFSNQIWKISVAKLFSINGSLQFLIIFCNNDLIQIFGWLSEMKKPEVYSEPSQTFKMELSAVDYFRKTLLLRCLTGFWKRLWKLYYFNNFMSTTLMSTT